MKRPFAIFAFLLLFGFGAGPAWALEYESQPRHPISIVDAFIFVKKFKTVMRLSFFAEDLQMLQGVEALEDGFYDSEELLEATEDHIKFIEERMLLIKANGERLTGKLIEKVDIQFPEDDDGTPQRIRAGDLMNFKIQLTYEFNHEDPLQFLTINQKLTSEEDLYKSEVKTVVNQAGNADALLVKILKPDQPETVEIDWENPALDADLTDAEWEKRAAEQLEKNLGIESYSSTYSFIYITRKEVRHEILIPLATLATFITDLEQADENYLDIPEQDAAKSKIETMFAQINPVTIDSIPVAPKFDRIDFYGLDLRDFAMQAERRRVSMANGRVGIIMSYSAKSTPKEVSVEWELFNNIVQKVEATSFVFDKAEKFTFSRFQRRTDDDGNVDNQANIYRPANLQATTSAPIQQVSAQYDFANLAPPVIEPQKLSISLGYFLAAGCLFLCLVSLYFRNAKFSFVFGACAPILLITTLTGGFPTPILFNHPSKPARFLIPNEDGKEVFAKLHQNIFRAFDYPDQSVIYDALANSVDGPLLRETVLEDQR